MIDDNIYSILSSKPHNIHYLNRYINFINSCFIANKTISNTTYTENHHICPKSKSLFPEYKELKQFPWNKIKLTFRQHVLAHYILAKTYNTWECWESVRRTAKQKNVSSIKSINTKTLELVNKNVKQTKKGVFTRGMMKLEPLMLSNQQKIY